MIGAMTGDMIGAPYEFDRGNKSKDFPLFSRHSHFTDDSVMTIAVAEALLSLKGDEDDAAVHKAVTRSMRKWGRRYPNAGYGARFANWLFARNPRPYGSYGNGSAMRVSSVGWLFRTMEETLRYARLTAEVTHNHPEGIKGAQVTAAAIFLARNGAAKEEIREYIIKTFGYDLSRSCDEIRPSYRHVESCQKTVPEAITAFLEGKDFEDVIRTAVSLGGDCDTLTCIAAGIAEAFYGIPEEIRQECEKRLPKDMLKVMRQFEKRVRESSLSKQDPFLAGNERIEEAIAGYHVSSSKETLTDVLEALRQRMHADGRFLLPAEVDEEDRNSFAFRGIKTKDGRLWHAAFTSHAEYEKGPQSHVLSFFIDKSMKFTLETDAAGIIINPWGQSFLLEKEMMEMIFAADGGVEYTVPDDPITKELLEDGSFLKRAVEICHRNHTTLNLIKLARILRDSVVWIPCSVVVGEQDDERVGRMIKEAEETGDLQSMVGRTITFSESVRLVPDLLHNGEDFFFPVFSAAEEMGEYGERFSPIDCPFLDAVNLAENSEKKPAGIVINAFSNPVIVPKKMFAIIAGMASSLDTPEESQE